jgi:mannose-1-phosphate guanylyltransferase
VETGVQLLLQGGALGMLAYLIWWTTREGAPKLFTHLSGIATAMQSTASRLEALEEAVKALQTDVKKLQDVEE